MAGSFSNKLSDIYGHGLISLQLHFIAVVNFQKGHILDGLTLNSCGLLFLQFKAKRSSCLLICTKYFKGNSLRNKNFSSMFCGIHRN